MISITVDKVHSLVIKVEKRLEQENMDWYFFEEDTDGSCSGLEVCQRLNQAVEKLTAAKKVVAAMPATSRGEGLTAAIVEPALLDADRIKLSLPGYVRTTLTMRAITEYTNNTEYIHVAVALSSEPDPAEKASEGHRRDLDTG